MLIPLVAARIVARKAALSTARGVKKAKRIRQLPGARKKVRDKRKGLGRSKMRDDRPYLMSVEGIAMMTIAVLLDFIPPLIVIPLDLLFGFGELISWPLDILGTIVLGGWMWFRGGEMTFGKKAGAISKKESPFYCWGIYTRCRRISLLDA